MNQEARSGTHLKDQLLALAVQGKNHVAAREWMGRRTRGAMQHVASKHTPVEHFRTENRGAKRASKTLDFREFRHA
jgi:hypothetical protein